MKKHKKKKGKSKVKNQKWIIWAAIAVALVIILGIASKGCAGEKQITTDPKESIETIDDMIDALNSGGFTAVKEENIKASSFAADDGAKTTIGETEIEFYLFNNKEQIKAGAKKAFENPSTKVLEKGDILIVIYSADTELISKIENLLI